jgi:hypothetical protein
VNNAIRLIARLPATIGKSLMEKLVISLANRTRAHRDELRAAILAKIPSASNGHFAGYPVCVDSIKVVSGSFKGMI